MNIRQYQGVFPIIKEGAWVDQSAVVIGKCVLEEGVSIWPNVTLRGDVNRIIVGARSNIQDGAVVHVTHESEWTRGAATTVGADVTVGHNATLHGCTIEDETLIGMNAVVLDGAVVQRHVVVGAHAIPVASHLPPGYLAHDTLSPGKGVGTPALPHLYLGTALFSACKRASWEAFGTEN